MNLASLANFQEVELEKKRKQAKKTLRQDVSGPTTCYLMNPDQTSVLIVPSLKEFPKPEKLKAM